MIELLRGVGTGRSVCGRLGEQEFGNGVPDGFIGHSDGLRVCVDLNGWQIWQTMLGRKTARNQIGGIRTVFSKGLKENQSDMMVATVRA